jgi:hypothetical protein
VQPSMTEPPRRLVLYATWGCHDNPTELSNHFLGDVVLVGVDDLLVDTGNDSCHRFGGMPLT